MKGRISPISTEKVQQAGASVVRAAEAGRESMKQFGTSFQRHQTEAITKAVAAEAAKEEK